MKKLFLLVVILNIVSVGNIVADDEVVHRIKVRDIAKDFSLLKDIKKGDFIVAFTGKNGSPTMIDVFTRICEYDSIKYVASNVEYSASCRYSGRVLDIKTVK
jgi:hypothetical protein